MSFKKITFSFFCCLLCSNGIFAKANTSKGELVKKQVKAKSKVKYKASGQIDFESLLIEGERKKPEMSVVTGNLGEKDSGLLKFRKNFLDVMADDIGESVE